MGSAATPRLALFCISNPFILWGFEPHYTEYDDINLSTKSNPSGPGIVTKIPNLAIYHIHHTTVLVLVVTRNRGSQYLAG